MQPTVMANDDEVADIMAAMQESVRRSWQKTSESESGTLKYFQLIWSLWLIYLMKFYEEIPYMPYLLKCGKKTASLTTKV